MLARIEGVKPGNIHEAAKRLIAVAGHIGPKQLSAAHITDLNNALAKADLSNTTKAHYSGAMRRLLVYLWEFFGAKKLDAQVTRFASIRPRNVVATDEELFAIKEAAPDHIKLWLLLCSDLAIRSGTAARLGPQNYDPKRRILTFKTKYQEGVRIPVTEEVEALLTTCDMDHPASFVRQLWQRHGRQNKHHGPGPADTGEPSGLAAQFKALRLSLGITRKVTPHDFRRRTAVEVYDQTKDLREVQAVLGHTSIASTVWYLDHFMRPIQRATLENAKRPHLVKKENIA